MRFFEFPCRVTPSDEDVVLTATSQLSASDKYSAWSIDDDDDLEVVEL